MGYRVLAIDAGKRDYCLSVGAEAYLDATEATADAVEKIGVLQAAIVTAGVGRAHQAAMDFLVPFGTLVCVGIPPPDQRVSFHPVELVNKGIRIIGSAVGTRQDILEAVEFVSRGVVKASISIASLDDLTDISTKFDKGTINYVINV